MAKKNLGIVGLSATNLRINKRGLIQYSTDNAKTWNNLRDIKEWVNLYTGPLDDMYGDGSSDNIIKELTDIKQKLDEIGGASTETIESLEERLSNIEA